MRTSAYQIDSCVRCNQYEKQLIATPLDVPLMLLDGEFGSRP
jgi:hypothetical protein